MKRKKKKNQEKEDGNREENWDPLPDFVKEDPEKYRDWWDVQHDLDNGCQFENSAISDRVIYVKYPPQLPKPVLKEQIPSLPNNFITATDISYNLNGMGFYYSLMNLTWYENDQSIPKGVGLLAALETFVHSFKAGVYPPQRVLEYLARGIEKYLESEGKLSLEKALGIRFKRGERSVFNKKKEYRRNATLIYEMGQLIHLFDVSIDAAARMISSALEEEPGKPNPYIIARFPDDPEVKHLKEATILEIFYDSERKESMENHFTQRKKYGIDIPNLNDRQAYISLFPYLSLPDALRCFHPDDEKKFHDR